ncbi:hypothetical protein [Gracilibacillus sp. YIM 98692]|uniref:DUF7003 family protein n=1 Tax=Gracilibacillus sp. YIM 98692 TaxID=2663532 RepID=UPI0013CF8673|nr:hypothetical protein [Gracilibacillus sp. YIM 98692]
MESKKILQMLDNYASEFEFPVLDNYNFDLAQCRLTVFKKQAEWLIIIEMVGARNDAIENVIYAYGNCIKQNGIIISVDNLVSLDNDEWWYDDDGKLVLNPLRLKLNIQQEQIEISPTKEDYKKYGIEMEPFSLTKLIRFLSSQYSEKLWLSTQELLMEVGIQNKMPMFFQIKEWEHPDISQGQVPSDSPFFQQLSNAIENNDISYIKLNKPNTHWSNWTWSDLDT